jgi:hypothetical protein
MEVLKKCRNAAWPYDEAVSLLGFHKPAIKVASSEGCRRLFALDSELMKAVDQRLSAGQDRDAHQLHTRLREGTVR